MVCVEEFQDNVYHTKAPQEVSGFQANPTISLEFVALFNLPLHASLV